MSEAINLSPRSSVLTVFHLFTITIARVQNGLDCILLPLHFNTSSIFGFRSESVLFRVSRAKHDQLKVQASELLLQGLLHRRGEYCFLFSFFFLVR